MPHHAFFALRSSTLFAAVLLASFVGCEKFESGGGSRSVSSGATQSLAVFGTGAGRELAFVIFLDETSDGSHASGGSSWTGTIKPGQGQAIDYQGSAKGIEINGKEYSFASGKVFLLSTKGGEPSVTQLDVPIEAAAFSTEIDRISKTADVQAFLED